MAHLIFTSISIYTLRIFSKRTAKKYKYSFFLLLLFFYFCVDPCRLACIQKNLVRLYGSVSDGTRCAGHPEIFDVCIEGKCRVSRFVITYLSDVKKKYDCLFAHR